MRGMTPADLAIIGEALYGPRWRMPLASALEVNERTVRRWCAGTSPVPRGAAAELQALLERAEQKLAAAKATLAAAADFPA